MNGDMRIMNKGKKGQAVGISVSPFNPFNFLAYSSIMNY
jgi:hypothetical protein